VVLMEEVLSAVRHPCLVEAADRAGPLGQNHLVDEGQKEELVAAGLEAESSFAIKFKARSTKHEARSTKDVRSDLDLFDRFFSNANCPLDNTRGGRYFYQSFCIQWPI